MVAKDGAKRSVLEHRSHVSVIQWDQSTRYGRKISGVELGGIRSHSLPRSLPHRLRQPAFSLLDIHRTDLSANVAHRAVQIGTIAGGETDNTDNNDSDNDDTDNKILTPPSPNTDVEHAGRVDNPMDHGFRATTVGQEEQTSNHLPEAPPVRDYRDANGIDHGYAMGEALLNPRPDPWALI